MEINIDFGIPVIDLDQLIRRALQDHFFEIQPPATVWGSIQRHLVNRRHRIPEASDAWASNRHNLNENPAF